LAGFFLHASSGAVALPSSGTKTFLQIIAAAGHRVRCQSIGIASSGTSSTDPPFLVQIVRQTTAGTMTAGTNGTNLSRKNDTDAETIQTTTRVNATVEPTTTDIIWEMYVHPQSPYKEYFPLGQEIYIPNGERLGVRITTSAAITYNTTVEMDLEE